MPVGHLRRRGDRRFDVTSRVGIRPVDIHAADYAGQSRAAGRVRDGDDLLQLRTPGVEPAPVQHGGHGQRRCGRVVDGACVAAAVRTVPPTAGGDPVHDVRGEQFDAPLGQRLGQGVGKPTVFVVAHPAVRTLIVDHDGDRGVRFRGGGHIGEVLDGAGQLIGKVNAHNASHLAAIDGDQNERFLGHEAQDGGQGGDQYAGPVQTEVG